MRSAGDLSGPSELALDLLTGELPLLLRLTYQCNKSNHAISACYAKIGVFLELWRRLQVSPPAAATARWLVHIELQLQYAPR